MWKWLKKLLLRKTKIVVTPKDLSPKQRAFINRKRK